MSSTWTRPKGAYRTFAGLAAILLALALPGCCDDDDHHHDDDFDEPFGTLEVFNDDSFDIIETVELADIFAPYNEFFDGLNLFPGDSVEFDLFPSAYEVTVYWDNVVITSSVEDVFDGVFLTIFVSNDP